MTSPVNTRGDTRTTTMTSSPAAQVSVAELVAAVIALPVSDAARAAARARLADTAFATLVGSETAQGRASVNLAAELYGRSSLAAQAFRLSAACRLTEIDDVDLLSCITPGSIVVPTVLAVLSANPGAAPSLEAVLDTIARGYELALVLGEAMQGPRRLAYGIWPSLAVSGVTAAAVTSVLLGASNRDVEAATALAAQQSVSGNPRGNAREIQFATAVATGIGAALAARHGFSVHGTRGAGAVGDLLVAEVPLAGVTERVFRPAVKSFCSARQAMTSVTALREILRESPLAPGEIERIDVEVPAEYAAMLDKRVVSSRRESLSSAQYQLALAAHEPAGLFDVARDRIRTDISFRATMNAVQVVASAELSARYPEQWPARVRLTAGASTYYAKADEVPGERDYSPTALQVKLRNFCAAPGSPDARSEAAARIGSRSLSATSVDELRELTTVIDGETAEGIRDLHV
jgi:2-methylcitrate dehydratase PrpD